MGNRSSFKRCGACGKSTKVIKRVSCKHCDAEKWLPVGDEATPSQKDTHDLTPPVPPTPSDTKAEVSHTYVPASQEHDLPPAPPDPSQTVGPKCLPPKPVVGQKDSEAGSGPPIPPPVSHSTVPVEKQQVTGTTMGVCARESHNSQSPKTHRDCDDSTTGAPPTASNGAAVPVEERQPTRVSPGVLGGKEGIASLTIRCTASTINLHAAAAAEVDDMMNASSDSDFDSGLEEEGVELVVNDWLDQQDDHVAVTTDASSKAAEKKASESSSCKFFDQFPPHMQAALIEALEGQDFKDGEIVVKQGDKGDTFYVISEGEAAISVLDHKTQSERLLTHIYAGAHFGETALLYGIKRTATVRAVGPLRCNVLTRAKYQTMPQELRLFLVLQKCDLIQHLNQHEQIAICKCLEPVEFEKGDFVVREGDLVKPNDSAFFMITKGEVEVLDKADGHLVNLRQGHSFGEMALINDAKRNASVRVVSDILTCMTLRKAAFAGCCDGEDGSFTDKLRTITKRLEKVRSRRHSLHATQSARELGGGCVKTVDLSPMRQKGHEHLSKKGSVSHFQLAAKTYTSQMTPRSRAAARSGGFARTVNEYIVLHTLGKGSFADVKLVQHSVTKAYHAMKVVNRRALKKINNMSKFGDDLNKQLMLEIKIMYLLNHKFIVQIHEVVDDSETDCLYIMMEYGEGGTIMPDAEEAGGAQPLDPDVACRYTRQIIYALEYMHKCGVIHRDLKPQNILLSEDKLTIKICDFGTACITSQGETLTVPKGTPAFMAPEILLQETVHYSGPPADVWSLGATMYMMVCGCQPWVASDYMALSHKVRHDELLFPENDLDPHLRNLLVQILTKDPKRRPTLEALRVHDWITTEGIDPMLKQEL